MQTRVPKLVFAVARSLFPSVPDGHIEREYRSASGRVALLVVGFNVVGSFLDREVVREVARFSVSGWATRSHLPFFSS